MTQASALYHLQSLESQTDRIRQRLIEIDRILGEDSAIQKAVAVLDAAAQRRQKWMTKQKDLELERQKTSSEADTTEERLYSGRVLNPRELTDMQQKLKELRKHFADLEEPVLEAMLEVEQASEDVQNAEANLQTLHKEKKDELGSLTAERENLLAELSTLEEQAFTQRGEIETAYIATYDSLRKRPGGIAVVQLSDNGECGVCGVQVTSAMKQQVRRGEVHTCGTCGRLLYL